MNQNNSSKTPEALRDYWQTPWRLVRQLSDMCHVRFALDVCALPETSKADEYIDEDQDALSIDWWLPFMQGRDSSELRQSVVFCNPPFSAMDLWIDKAIIESKNGLTVFMLHADTPDRAWFQKIEQHCFVQYVPDGRIQYLLPDGSRPRNGVNFPSCVSVFNGWHNDAVRRVRFERQKAKYEKLATQ